MFHFFFFFFFAYMFQILAKSRFTYFRREKISTILTLIDLREIKRKQFLNYFLNKTNIKENLYL